MMKRVVAYTGLSILLGIVGFCYADGEDKGEVKDTDVQTDGEKGAPENELNPVAQALTKLHFFNGEPAKDAKYYIYLQSASWCPPCRAEMPEIVKEYNEMRKAGVEIVLVACDRTEADAKAYLEQFKATFPGFMPMELKENKLPGLTLSDTIPHATFVDADGRVLKSGHGSITLDWKNIISAGAAGEEESIPVAQALTKLHFFNGEPVKDAKYYIYLQSAGWCPPCRAEMPEIVKEYSEMRKAGVEIVLVACDRTEEDAKAYLEKFKATFSGFMPMELKENKLPGLTLSHTIPHAIFVDANGKVLKSGHGSITLDWRNIISADTKEEEKEGEKEGEKEVPGGDGEKEEQS